MLVHGAAAAILNYQREVVLMRKAQDSGTELFMRGLATAPDRDLAVEMSTDTPAQTTNLKKKICLLTGLRCWKHLLWATDQRSVQVGKAVFVEESCATQGFEPRTFSWSG